MKTGEGAFDNPEGIEMIQPRVARNELPWVSGKRISSTLKELNPSTRRPFSYAWSRRYTAEELRGEVGEAVSVGDAAGAVKVRGNVMPVCRAGQICGSLNPVGAIRQR